MDITNGGLLYQLFYVLAFVAAYAILIYEGFRRKFPLLSWVLILAFIRLAVVIGTKLFSYSSDEWSYMLQNHTLLQNPEKTMFGGVLLGVGAYLIARYLLKFRHSAWDTVAIAFPVAVSIQTIGCFFYGCCFGSVCHMPWAVQYPVMSLAHYHQFSAGLLTYNDLYSLPVHPVQLYQALGGMLVILLVIRFRRLWKAEGSLLLSSVIFFALARFLIEFFRDPLSNKTGGEMFWIFKLVQWQYLFFALLMSLILLWREKTFKLKAVVKSTAMPGLHIQVAFLITLALILLILRRWFTIPELIALNISLLPAVFLVGYEIYKVFATLRFKWIYALTVIMPLFLMSQTMPQTQIDTTATKKYTTYHTVGGGFATGNYTDERTSYTGSGCDRVSNYRYFDQKYTGFGGGYSYTKISSDKNEVIRYGSNIFFADYDQLRQSDNQNISMLLFGVNPYIHYDSRWFGIGGGLHLGNLAFASGDSHQETSQVFTRSYFKTPIFPQFYFRVGPVRYFFADFHLADQFPVPAPGLAFQAGFGTGFGIKNGTNLRFGLSFLEEASVYLSAYVPIDDRIVVEPLFLWTDKSSVYPLYPVSLPENQFSIALSYRFGHKY